LTLCLPPWPIPPPPLLDSVVLGPTEVAHRLARQISSLSLNLEDVLDGRLFVGQFDFAELHLFLVLDAQFTASVPVENDVTTFPDVQDIATTLSLDTLLQGHVLALGLHGDQRLKSWVNLQGLRVYPAEVWLGSRIVDRLGL